MNALLSASSRVMHILRELAKKYPQYGFEQHKGYGTEMHYAMLEKYGISDVHRKSFLKKLINDGQG